MSEQTPAPQDTSEAGPEGTPGEQHQDQAVDYEKRYNDLRPEFDRTKQQLSQYEQDAQNWARLQQDPEFQAQWLRDLGYEIDDGDPDEFEDPTEQIRQELEQLKGQFSQQQQAAQEQARLQVIEQSVEQQLAAIPDLEEADKDWIVSRAVALEPTADGMPDIQAAYRELVAWEQQRQKKWAQSKKAPHISPVGTPGTQAPDLSDDDARVAHMTQRFMDLSAD